jgi:hypothetical protein
MAATPRSTSPAAARLLWGPRREGAGLGHGYIGFGDQVLATTRVGGPRMPNGLECDVTVPRRAAVVIGEGQLSIDGEVVLRAGEPGSVSCWNPVPEVRVRLHCSEPFDPDPARLAGRGEGLTPLGDDLLCGYAAGLVLWHGRHDDAREIAATAAPRTSLLSATLLRHAARGELPEPAHALLERGDLGPLRGFGRTSGGALARGLALACGAERAGAICC